PREAALLYTNLDSNVDRGPRVSLEEWRALGEVGQNSLRPFLESWELAIVNGWSARDREPSSMSWSRILVLACLSYFVFCFFFAFFQGIRTSYHDDGFHFRFWESVWIDVPGIVYSDIKVKAAVRRYMSFNFRYDVVPEPDKKWNVERQVGSNYWDVSLKVRIPPPRGRDVDLTSAFSVSCDHYGYYVWYHGD
ncbi:MAG TPA: hypothetical protein PKI32_06555, partial [Opitutales bacterium]|nr:hypothetical protein [Opitutales bacterium]